MSRITIGKSDHQSLVPNHAEWAIIRRMNRRVFLKLVAGTSAAAIVPLRLIEGDPLDGETWIGMVRETVEYEHGCRVLSHGILAGPYLQINVSHRMEDDNDIKRLRRQSIEALRANLQERGINVKDLLPLEDYTLGGLRRA